MKGSAGWEGAVPMETRRSVGRSSSKDGSLQRSARQRERQRQQQQEWRDLYHHSNTSDEDNNARIYAATLLQSYTSRKCKTICFQFIIK